MLFQCNSRLRAVSDGDFSADSAVLITDNQCNFRVKLTRIDAAGS
jgi:hypothetical protein